MISDTVLPRVLACLLAWFALTGPTSAQEAQENPQALTAAARSYLEELAGATAQATGGVARIVVGSPDPRLKLADCPALQAALPPGARRSGKTLVVVRCVGGRAWQVFLPAEIHVEAPVWFTAHALANGPQ